MAADVTGDREKPLRIAILNWTNRWFGGTGTYLSTLMPALQAAGHDCALWHEVDRPSEHSVLPVPAAAPVWSVSTLGLQGAVDALREWRPDLLYAHGLLDPSVEERALDVAPAVLFVHDYYGTCISGSKTLTKPVVTPCSRAFGWQCLAQYYPRRCGGLSPVSMVRQFRLQRHRFELLPRYAAIVTNSGHMQREYVKHGVSTDRVINVGYGSDLGGPSRVDQGNGRPDDTRRLLFVGRMDPLKGGRELLQALPHVAARVNGSLHMTFAGDGPQRSAWEALASAISRDDPRIQVEFRGWVDRDAISSLYRQSHVLVVPSLWPEPFGFVGLEAIRHHVPAVAFDVGGISEWLKPGINGVLAPGNPPTVQGLADAIVEGLRAGRACDGEQLERLSASFSVDAHLRRLLRVFGDVVQ
jgi:glycosyltransferase involved in cell wall biosynthesis